VTAAGGGFHFDPDKVQTAINELNAILDGMPTDLQKAQRLIHVDRPGPDRVTGGFHSAMQKSHEEHLKALQEFRAKVTNQIANLQAAMKQYHETEAANKHGLGQRGV